MRLSARSGTRWLVVAVLAVLAGCAPLRKGPSVKVILLPQSDGSSSAVVVTSAAGVQTLNKPYQSLDAGVGLLNRPTVRLNEPGQINRQFQPLFALAPAKPSRYVVYFRSGTTDLTAQSRITLFDAIMDAMNRSGAEIELIGHTDTEGSQRLNERLSELRARHVETLLVERGLSVTRMEAVGRGEREPAVATRDGVEEPRNRRVEILVR